MEQNLISVIIPIYKTGEVRLRKAIESVLNQSYRNLEIILVDDGSPDQCGTICDLYASTDDRIQVIHKANEGVSSARNRALEIAGGDYIFFMDSDDTIKRNTIEILFLNTKRTNADITICSCNHIEKGMNDNTESDNSLAHIKIANQQEAVENISYNTHVFDELETTAVWGKLYSKTIVQNLRFNEKLKIAEDFVFNYFAICNSKIVAYCDLKLYNYNTIETSLMNNKVYSPNIMQSFKELIKFEESQRSTQYSNGLIARCVNISFTLYLRIPKVYAEECRQVEAYIRENRRSVLKNNKVVIKVKAACLISYVGFGCVRFLYSMTDK